MAQTLVNALYIGKYMTCYKQFSQLKRAQIRIFGVIKIKLDMRERTRKFEISNWRINRKKVKFQ